MKDKKQITKRWNSYNYDRNQTTEQNSGELLVQPDQAFTIREVFEKFRLGVPVGFSDNAYYTDTDDFDEVDERQLVRDHTDISEAEERISARRKAKAEAQASGAGKGSSEADNASGDGASAKAEVLKP